MKIKASTSKVIAYERGKVFNNGRLWFCGFVVYKHVIGVKFIEYVVPFCDNQPGQANVRV